MITACMLGGLAGAMASVLAGAWCGLGLPGLVTLYAFGGAVSFLITLAIVMMPLSEAETPAKP